MLEKAKKIWKEHKKEIIFGGVIGVIGVLTAKNTFDNRKNYKLIEKEHDHVEMIVDEANEEFKFFTHNVNYLADKMNLSEEEWEPIHGYDRETGKMIY